MLLSFLRSSRASDSVAAEVRGDWRFAVGARIASGPEPSMLSDGLLRMKPQLEPALERLAPLAPHEVTSS